MQNQPPSMMKAALIPGIAFGVIAAIPLLEMGNCLCCAYIWGCGLVAAYLQSNAFKEAGLAFGAGDGGMVGLVSGLIYGVVSGVLGGLKLLVFGATDQIQEAIEQMRASGADEQAIEFAEKFGAMFAGGLGVLLALLIAVVLGLIFGGIGGLIGGMIFKKEGPPPPTPTAAVPPAAPGPPPAPPTA